MPYKDIQRRRQYDKEYKQKKRNRANNDVSNPVSNPDLQLVMNELTTKSILPRHIYEFRQILRQMLKTYFKKKIIRVFDRTEIITLSWSNYC
jgi:hypothetical protein